MLTKFPEPRLGIYFRGLVKFTSKEVFYSGLLYSDLKLSGKELLVPSVCI